MLVQDSNTWIGILVFLIYFYFFVTTNFPTTVATDPYVFFGGPRVGHGNYSNFHFFVSKDLLCCILLFSIALSWAPQSLYLNCLNMVASHLLRSDYAERLINERFLKSILYPYRNPTTFSAGSF